MIRQLIHSKLLSGNKAGIFQKCQIFTGQTQDLLKKQNKKKTWITVNMFHINEGMMVLL